MGGGAVGVREMVLEQDDGVGVVEVERAAEGGVQQVRRHGAVVLDDEAVVGSDEAARACAAVPVDAVDVECVSRHDLLRERLRARRWSVERAGRGEPLLCEWEQAARAENRGGQGIAVGDQLVDGDLFATSDAVDQANVG